jgi:glycerophosphoryl diester phosphodiesterase
MAQAAIREHHRPVPVNTARVTADPNARRGTSPVTGYPYLDAVLDRPGSVIAMAHRGGALHPEIPGMENTLHAFEHAVALGYRYLETDVHASKDGVLLAFHDAALDRVTDTSGRLADLTAEQISAVRIGGEHAVPTMAELLESFPGCRFNIDLKSEGAIEPLVTLLDRTRAHDRVCVGSFSWSRIRAFRRATDGRVATAAAPAEVAAFLVPVPGRLLRVTAGRAAQVLQVPWRHRQRRVTVVTPAFVRRAHDAGVHVHVWTGDEHSQWVSIDEPESMHTLLDMGVDGLITDRTDVLKQVLLSRGQWMGETP